MSLEALEEVFDLMAMSVDASVERCGLILQLELAFAWYGAASGTMLAERLAEAQAVEPLISHKMNVAKGFEHLACRGLIMQVARVRTKAQRLPSLIHSAKQLGGNASA